MVNVMVVDPTMADDLVAHVNAFDSEMWAESDPGESSYPIGVTRMSLTETWRSFEHQRWAAWCEGTIAGMARVDVHVGDPTDPTVSIDLRVAPAYRNQGVGHALLAEAVSDCKRRGRTILGATTTDRVAAGARFAERRGATIKLVERESECDLAGVDQRLIERWCAGGTAIADEYELWRSTGPYPPESYALIAELQNVQNSQPFDDLERRDVRFTADHVAHGEAQRDWTLSDRWTHFIRHRQTGRLVGYTRLYLSRTWPGLAEQGDTAVDPTHRLRGLGKWLKGSMIHCLLNERPDVTRIRTTNAFTNGPMVAINDALGFRVIRTHSHWQADVT